MICASVCITSRMSLTLEKKFRGSRSMDQKLNANKHRMAARGNATSFPLPWEDLLKQLQDGEEMGVSFLGQILLACPNVPTPKDGATTLDYLLVTNLRADLLHSNLACDQVQVFPQRPQFSLPFFFELYEYNCQGQILDDGS